MKKLAVLIVDDEPLARSGLRKLVEKTAEWEVVADAANGMAALAALREHSPDLMLLDVQMPGMTGIQMLEQLPAGKIPAIIFCTAHDEYALKAFELHAVDYLLKPFSNRRFAEALARAHANLRPENTGQIARQLEELVGYFRHNSGAAAGGHPGVRPDRIVVKADGDLHFLNCADIIWIEGQGDYLKIHHTQQPLLVRETMTQLEQKLGSPRFVRVHKSAIVNLDHVRKLRGIHYGDHAVEMDNGSSVRIGRTYREKLGKNAWPGSGIAGP